VSYHWPGNLRELNRVIHTAVALCEGEIITPADLLLGDQSHNALVEKELAAKSLVMAQPFAQAPTQIIELLSLRDLEARHIKDVLEQLRGNKKKAAQVLGISRSTLDRKLAELS